MSHIDNSRMVAWPSETQRIAGKISHYGVIVEAERPTTGVYSGNDVQWMWDEDYIDPSYGWHCTYCGSELEEFLSESCEACGVEFEEGDFDESGGDIQLYGSWKNIAIDEKYEPDESGEYAAIYDSNTNVIQVVWSKYVRFGRMASPCYPGQVDARPEDPTSPKGQCAQAHYALPPEFLQEEDYNG